MRKPAPLANVNSVCYNGVMDCLEGVPSLERDDPFMLWLPPGPIHTSFVSKSWTGAPGVWSFQPPTPFRNLWAKSLPDGSWASAELLQQRRSQHASQQQPSFLESLCWQRALIWSQIMSPEFSPSRCPGSWFCAVRRCHWVAENGCLAPWAADAQACSLWVLPAVAPWPGVPRHPAFSINGLQVCTHWLY